MRRDILAAWLPEALATLCAFVGATVGANIDPADLLEDWGLVTAETAADRNAAQSLDNLRAWARARKAEKGK